MKLIFLLYEEFHIEKSVKNYKKISEIKTNSSPHY